MKRVCIVWAVPPVALLFLILLPAPHPMAADTPVVDMSRPQQALYVVQAQAALNGWTPTLAVQAGDVWRGAGDLARAVPYWQMALRLDPGAGEVIWRLATAYMDQHDWARAVPLLEQLKGQEAYVRRASYHLGLIRAALDPAQAVVDLRVAARDPALGSVTADVLNVLLADPTRPDLPLRIGETLLQHELWSYAEIAYRHAIDLDPANGVAAAYVALTRLREDKNSDQWVTRALAYAPTSGFVQYVTGLQRRAAGDTQNSLAAFIQAAALEPDNPAFYAELGAAYRLIGDMENAERWLRMAVTTSLNDPRFTELLALFYAEEGYNLDGVGLETLAAVREVQPDAPDVLASYGWALYRLGQVEQAVAQLNAALEVDPANPRALYYLAQLRLAQGEDGEALGLLEQVAALESDFHEEAQRTLNVLRGE